MIHNASYLRLYINRSVWFFHPPHHHTWKSAIFVVYEYLIKLASCSDKEIEITNILQIENTCVTHMNFPAPPFRLLPKGCSLFPIATYLHSSYLSHMLVILRERSKQKGCTQCWIQFDIPFQFVLQGSWTLWRLRYEIYCVDYWMSDIYEVHIELERYSCSLKYKENIFIFILISACNVINCRLHKVVSYIITGYLSV